MPRKSLLVDHTHHRGIFWWCPVNVYLWITLITQVSSGDALKCLPVDHPHHTGIFWWCPEVSTCGSPSSHRYLLVMPCECLPVDHPHYRCIFWWCPVKVYLWITLIAEVLCHNALTSITGGTIFGNKVEMMYSPEEVSSHNSVSFTGGKLLPTRRRWHSQSLKPITLTTDVSSMTALSSSKGGKLSRKKVEMTLSVSTCGSLTPQRYTLTMLSLLPQVVNFHQQGGDDTQFLPTDHSHHQEGGEHIVGFYLQIIEVYSHNALSSITGGKLSPSRQRTHCRSLPADHSHHRGIFSQCSLSNIFSQCSLSNIFSQCSLSNQKWTTFTNKVEMTPLSLYLWITHITEVNSHYVFSSTTVGE